MALPWMRRSRGQGRAADHGTLVPAVAVLLLKVQNSFGLNHYMVLSRGAVSYSSVLYLVST